MKVKVGNKVYTKEDGPIMVILTEDDKKNIAAMSITATKYCEFDDVQDNPDDVSKWMDDA